MEAQKSALQVEVPKSFVGKLQDLRIRSMQLDRDNAKLRSDLMDQL